jgi:phosphate transport system substrate-binding protein
MKQTAIVISLGAILACSAMPVCAEEIIIGGGGSPINFIFKPNQKDYEKDTGNKLILLQSTPGKGVMALVEGKLNVATSAVALDMALAEATKEGARIDPATLKVTELGKTRFVLLVNKDNPVNTLTKEQVKGIFTGKIQNWKEVGGADLPVMVVKGQNTPGQNATLQKTYLDGEKFASELLDVKDQPAITDIVGQMKEAIGINPVGLVKGNVKAVDSQPYMDTPYIMITKGEPTGEVKKMIDYMRVKITK